MPAPGRRTLDVVCGEGRLTRHLASLGHRVVGIDASPTLVAAARELAPDMELHVADAAALPFDDASFDQVVSFMCLHDVDDLPGAVREVARVQHRPISAYVEALASSGFVVDALREPTTVGHESWSRLPLSLHLRARKAAAGVTPRTS